MTDNIHFHIDGAYQYEAITKGICFQKSWHLLKYQKALALLDVHDNETVLDAACGSGVLTNMIAEQSNASVTGIDFSEAAIAFCKHQYKHDNLSFITSDLKEKTFAPESFNKIVMLEILEHLQPADAQVILANQFEYLKPGGKLVMSTPNKQSLWPAIEFLLDAMKLTPKMKDEQHVKLYTPSALKKVVTDVGFTVHQLHTSHFIAPWISFLGLKTAEAVHAAEQKLRVLPGSLLFIVAEKR
jgi:2-polyprenyl-3-methyl-5-hydroxy-6-metoxy-1,4-benzoquinol methylase